MTAIPGDAVVQTSDKGLPKCCWQVYAQGGDRAEAQHGGSQAVHPRAQREDLPLPGDERRLPDRVAPRGACPAAPPPPQPLPGEEEGDHQKAFVLHRYQKDRDLPCF